MAQDRFTFAAGRIWYSILVSVLLVLAGVWMLVVGPVVSFPLLASSAVNRVFGLIGILMFTYTLVFSCWGLVRLKRRTPALELDSEGLTLRLFGPTQRVLWGDVASVSHTEGKGTKVVLKTSKRTLHLVPASYEGDMTAEELADLIRSYLVK